MPNAASGVVATIPPAYLEAYRPGYVKYATDMQTSGGTPLSFQDWASQQYAVHQMPTNTLPTTPSAAPQPSTMQNLNTLFHILTGAK